MEYSRCKNNHCLASCWGWWSKPRPQRIISSPRCPRKCTIFMCSFIGQAALLRLLWVEGGKGGRGEKRGWSTIICWAPSLSVCWARNLYSSQQAHVEAVFLFYRRRIRDSANFPKTTKLKSSRAKVWLWPEACAFSAETLSSSWQSASVSVGDGFSMSSFLHFRSRSLILITLHWPGSVSITELSVQQASLRPGADLVGPGAQHWTTWMCLWLCAQKLISHHRHVNMGLRPGWEERACLSAPAGRHCRRETWGQSRHFLCPAERWPEGHLRGLGAGGSAPCAKRRVFS